MSALQSSTKQRIVPRRTSFLQPNVNPFVYELHLTKLQKLQIAVMSVTVAPIRCLMIIILFFLTWFWGVFVTFGMPAYPKKPLGPIRKAFCSTLRGLARAMLFFMGFHSISVKGKRASTSEAPILVVAPHSSMLDVFVSFVTIPIPSSVARVETLHTPFLGRLSKIVQPVFVSRNDPDSRRHTINEILRRIGMPGCWPQILIYPEGTCSNRKALITFKAGAFIPGAPVQPVVIEYLNKLDTVTWSLKSPPALTLLWLTLCQFSLKTRVTYLPVYTPTQQEINDPKLFADNVRTVMAEYLHIPHTDHTFEDCRLMRQAAALNLPMESGLIEFTKLSRKLGLDISIMEEKLSEFAEIARERSDGLISIEDFSKFLHVPISPALQEMFKLYDRDQSGLIDFREYVIGLSLVSQPAVTEASVKLAFNVFDHDQNGTITEDEFIHVLQSTFGREVNGSKLFREIPKSCEDKITFEEFEAFMSNRPEYAKLFVYFSEMGEDYFEEGFPNLHNLFFTQKTKDMFIQRRSIAPAPQSSSNN